MALGKSASDSRIAARFFLKPEQLAGVIPRNHKAGIREMSERYVGVDVSKEHLDVASSEGWTLRVSNDAAGHARLCERLESDPPNLIVLEATGGLERCLAVALAAKELPVRVVNARLVRHFAKASGLLAKTDRIDAQVLVRFGQAMKPVSHCLRCRR